MTSTSLPLASPSGEGVDPSAVRAFLDAQEAAGQQMHSLQVVRHGHLVAQGWWAPWTPSDRALVYSLSKTFTSAVVGVCVADGVFGYDDTIVELLPHLAAETTGKTRRIRVRDCLSMATGHTHDLMDGVLTGLDASHITRMLATEPQGEPGETFCYNQIATYTLSVLVEHATGRDVHDLMRERVLDRIGCAPSSWQRDLEGRSLGYSGLQITAPTLAAFFQLLLDKGVHDGRQLLAPEWIERHCELQVVNGDDPDSDWAQGYGWQVWRARHGYRGDGAFGQYGVVLPEQDVVVAITSEVADMQITLDNLWKHLLPGLGRAPLPGSAADDELRDHLGTRQIPPLSAPFDGPTGDGVLPTSFIGSVDGDDIRLEWTERDGTRLAATVGLGRWERTTLQWPDGHADVAISGLLVDGRIHARLLMLTSPHSVDIVGADDHGAPGWARWRMQQLGVVRSLRDLRLREVAPATRAHA